LQNGRMTLGASTRSATAPSLPEMCDAGCRAPTKIGLLSPSDPLQTAYGNTTKSGALYTGAPVVIIPSLPDCAPAGTVTETCESELTMKFPATTLLNVIFEVCFRLTPLMTIVAPTAPLAGLKLTICGLTRNVLLLVSVPLGVVTVSKPLVACAGTTA